MEELRPDLATPFHRPPPLLPLQAGSAFPKTHLHGVLAQHCFPVGLARPQAGLATSNRPAPKRL